MITDYLKEKKFMQKREHAFKGIDFCDLPYNGSQSVATISWLYTNIPQNNRKIHVHRFEFEVC